VLRSSVGTALADSMRGGAAMTITPRTTSALGAALSVLPILLAGCSASDGEPTVTSGNEALTAGRIYVYSCAYEWGGQYLTTTLEVGSGGAQVLEIYEGSRTVYRYDGVTNGNGRNYEAIASGLWWVYGIPSGYLDGSNRGSYVGLWWSSDNRTWHKQYEMWCNLTGSKSSW
jgi:hypothetical protein